MQRLWFVFSLLLVFYSVVDYVQSGVWVTVGLGYHIV